ncbi:membrane-spanning 4-domains subfamily A member 14 [Hyaena hyaena]|uniref:membrane-spanning 4-domains subfamily A member 14 n=1 Tax=Hyaena hyaena TaxID=95912 RepID=UPI001921C520|nr:membrane-spanning 4-domains subfamily A member 14 [Hyaena hyaena]
MGSSSEVKRSSHIMVIQPNETVLTALPYEPQTSLLDFLKGEPKVLGAIQILLALIIVGVGTIFAFNYFNFSQRFPLVFLTGYPFWGAFIFVITGYITGINENKKCMGLGVTAMNVISSLVAVAGITLTIISYRHQHEYCQTPSLEGICVIGRILFNGILSVLLIISIVELGISVTIASFRSKCWTTSDEIVFFLSSDVTEESELSVLEENAVVQFELQEQSSTTDSTTNIQPVFIGGYTFFKLRITRNPLAFRHSRRRSSNSYYTSSVSMLEEQQKSIPPPSKLYEERPKLKSLPPKLQEMPTEETPYVKPLKDEDLQFAMAQHPEQPTQLLQSQTSPLQVLPSSSIKKLQVLPPQALPVQASPPPPSHDTESQGLTSEDMPYQDMPSQELQSQNMPSQDIQSLDMSSQYAAPQGMPFQNTLSQGMLSPNPPSEGILYQDLYSQPQALPAQPMLLDAPAFHAAQSSNMERLDQHTLDMQHQTQQLARLSYKDMQSEVILLTQDWKSEAEFHSKKSSKWQFLNWQNKNLQSLKSHDLEWQNKDQQTPKQNPPDPQTQGQQPLKKKSLDQHIKDWLSPKRHSIDKQTQVQETRKKSSDQQAKDQLLVSEEQSLRQQSPSRHRKYQQDKEEKPPKEQPKDRQDKAQQTDMERPPRKHTQHEQAEDLKVRKGKSPKEQRKDRKDKAQQTDMEQPPKQQPQYEEVENLQAQEKSLKQLHQNWQSQIQEYQAWQSLSQQSQDWRSQSWRNKERKVQDLEFEIPHSLKWESQVWQTQDLLEKESQKQKTLHQEGQNVHIITRHQQLQSIPLEDSQYQEEKQQDLKSTDIQKEGMQTETMQIRDSKPESIKYQNLHKHQSEDKKPDCCSSCQSSIQDAHSAYMSDINSEQDVRKNISICSTSYQEDTTLTSPSCSPKDQQQSEDSD